MIFSQKTAPTTTAAFDLLRSRLESDVQRPAVIAITSSTSEDGAEIAARGLSLSLASAGYRTIFIDASVAGAPSISKSAPRPEFEEMAKRAITESEVPGKLAVLSLSDQELQKRTSQRNVQSALEILCGTFDYVVANIEPGTATSFGASVLASASAVLVAVKKGRREKPADARLAAELQRPGIRFMGVVAIDSVLAKSDPKAFVPETIADSRHSQPLHVKKAYVAGE